MNIEMKDNLSIKDTIVNPKLSHGLHGHVTIHRRNKTTGETISKNVISVISLDVCHFFLSACLQLLGFETTL